MNISFRNQEALEAGVACERARRSEVSLVDNFFSALSAKIGRNPQSEYNTYCIGGANVKLGKQWGDTVYIATIRVPDKLRGKKLASFAMDEIVSLADIYNVKLKTDCSGVNDPKEGLSTVALKGLFERRGFRVIGEYPNNMGFEMERNPISVLAL